MSELPNDVPTLKAHAQALLQDIRANVAKGNFDLAPTITRAIVSDSSEEKAAMADLHSDDRIDALLKDKGLNRKARRSYIARLGRDAASVPAHTARAQKIANRKALERAAR